MSVFIILFTCKDCYWLSSFLLLSLKLLFQAWKKNVLVFKKISSRCYDIKYIKFKSSFKLHTFNFCYFVSSRRFTTSWIHYNFLDLEPTENFGIVNICALVTTKLTHLWNSNPLSITFSIRYSLCGLLPNFGKAIRLSARHRRP